MIKSYELTTDQQKLQQLEQIAAEQGVTVEELGERIIDRFLRSTNNVDASLRSGVTTLAKKGPRR